MEWLNQLAQNNDFPLLAAFALGLLTAIAPCPLATNITATAFISKTIKNKRTIMFSGLVYTLGRMLSYVIIGGLIYFGTSKFHLAKFFQSNGEKYLGFILVFLGLVMLNVIKIKIGNSSHLMDKLSDRFKNQGLLGSFLLGALFALAFCPYSGALFFAMLIPMTLASEYGLALPVLFSLGTGLPVIFFALIIAYSIEKLGNYFNAVTRFEKKMRIITGIVFLLTGLYYINIFFKIF